MLQAGNNRNKTQNIQQHFQEKTAYIHCKAVLRVSCLVPLSKLDDLFSQ